MTDFDLVLASQSPRRRELLSQIGVRYRVASADIEEVHQAGESPEDYVLRLARTKAQVSGHNTGAAVPVLGADTIGICQGQILEKPKDLEDARRMLTLMSGRSHQVLSAVALTDGNRTETATSVTEVFFRPLTLDEIDAYWQTGEPQDKSGAYAIQGLGAVFVNAIRGSFSNVVGLPIEALVPLLSKFSVPFWR